MIIATVTGLIARRVLAALLILLVVSLLLFCALRLLPVDPAAMSLPPTATIAEIEAKRHEMGLDLPLPEQYWIWLQDALHGDFGRSIQFRSTAGSLVAHALPATIELALSAMLLAGVLGVGGGLLLFRVRGTIFEPVMDTISILLLSVPEFLWGLILLFVFGVTLRLLPFIGQVAPDLPVPHISGFLLLDSLLIGRPDIFLSACRHLVLPAVALGLAFSPTIMRVLRSSLFDVYLEDYIQQARLRGLSEGQVLLRHAFKNASPPTLTLVGVQFGILFSGTLLVEVIYSYPGIGNLMVDAVRNADLPLIQSIGLTYCIMVLIINTVVDSLYVVLNPKLRAR
jgi:peptide/nickel transport system permease protein